MAKHKGHNQKKLQGAKNAQASKKAEIDKLVREAALAKAVKPSKKQVAAPRLFKPQPKLPILDVEAPFTRDVTIPIASPDSKTPIVRLPLNEVRKPQKPTTPQKPFPFLELPQELQDQIYDYIFDHPLTFHIKFVSKHGFGRRALTYSLPYQPERAQPKLNNDVWLRRRRLDYPRRVRSAEKDIPAYKIPTGFASLLHVHPRIAAGAAKYFYRLHTFRFTSMRALRTFLDMIPPSSKEAIQNLEISHYTAGHRYTAFRTRKAEYDDFYEMTLWRVAEEMLGLRSLAMRVRVNDVPLDFGPEVAWRKPFEALQDLNLSRVDVKVDHFFHEEHKDAMEVESYLISQELLAEQYRDDGCDAVERLSNEKVPEKLLPETKRPCIKILNITVPGFPRRF